MLPIVIGGMVAIFLISLLFGKLFFKNKDQTTKIIYSTILSYLVSVILSGFGNMNGAGVFSPFLIEYFISSVLLIVIRLGILKIKK